MYPLSKVLSRMVLTLKYYRDEILGTLGRLAPGIIGTLFLKYTLAISFLEHNSNFDLIFMLLIILFLEGCTLILLGR